MQGNFQYTPVQPYQPLRAARPYHPQSPIPPAQYSLYHYHPHSPPDMVLPPQGTAPYVPPYTPPPIHQPPKPAKSQPVRRVIEIVDPTTGQRVDITSFKKKEDTALDPPSDCQQQSPLNTNGDDGPLMLPSRPQSAPPTLTQREYVSTGSPHIDVVLVDSLAESSTSVCSPKVGKCVYTYEELMELCTEFPIPSHLLAEGLSEIFVEHLQRPASSKPAPSIPSLPTTPLGSPIKPVTVAGGLNREAFATASAPEAFLRDTQFTSRLPGRAQMGQRVPILVPIVVRPPPTPQLPNRAEEPFKPNQAGQKDSTKLLKKVVGILNRITPEKYNTLVQMLYEALDEGAHLINEDVLSSIIQQVHERAMEQPNYSDMWAMLSHDICIRIQEKAEGKTLENFRRILLNMCQGRFDEGIERLDDDQGMDRFRKHSKGNIKFIGELFKQNMLSERIMHRVIKKLLLETDHSDPRHADSLEVLATLLSTAGQNLDRPEALHYINHYFERMALLSKTHPVPRVRFMLLDVIELRKNGWKERRKEIKATKLSELEKQLAEGERAVQPANKRVGL